MWLGDGVQNNNNKYKGGYGNEKEDYRMFAGSYDDVWYRVGAGAATRERGDGGRAGRWGGDDHFYWKSLRFRDSD